jgi:hypothetical protein
VNALTDAYDWPVIIVGFVVGVLWPLTMVLITTFQLRLGKKQDAEAAAQVQQASWDREDEKEQRQIERQEHIAKLLLEANQRDAERAKVNASTLGVVHNLVNSQFTAQLQIAYDGVARELVWLNLLLASHKREGTDPDATMVAAVAAAKAKLAELRITLDERQRQSALIQKQADNKAAELSLKPPPEKGAP